MDKTVEFMDAWLKSQKDFLDNWVKTQREFLENWAEATRKLQDTFLSLGGPQIEGTPGKEMLTLYNSWMNSMNNSTKLLTDEMVKMQENWKNTVEKQMEFSREMLNNFGEFFRQGSGK